MSRLAGPDRAENHAKVLTEGPDAKNVLLVISAYKCYKTMYKPAHSQP